MKIQSQFLPRLVLIALAVIVTVLFFLPEITNKPYFWIDRYVKHHKQLKKYSLFAKILPAPQVVPFRYLNKSVFQKKLESPYPWVLAQIEQDLNQYGRFDAASVRETYEQSLPADNFNLFTVKNGQVTLESKLKKMNGACEYALNFYKGILSELAKQGLISDLSFILRLSDTTTKDYAHTTSKDLAPIFAVTKDTQKHIDQDAILIPDWMNLENWPKGRHKIITANKKFPWAEKINTIFWRGGQADMTGYRHKAVLLSQGLQHEKIDVQFTYGSLATTEFVPPEDHVPYKYQLNIDGHTAAWERPVWQLYSNSVLLKQYSALNQWFYPQIKPGTHYIDVGSDPKELLTVLNRYSDAELKNVAKAGQKFAENNLTPEDMMAYLVKALQAYEKRYQTTYRIKE